MKRNYKGKFFITSLSALALLAGCADDVELNKSGLTQDYNGFLSVQLSLADNQHIMTRSNDVEEERKVNNLSLLLCDGENVLKKRIDLSQNDIDNLQNAFNSESRTYTYQIAIDQDEIGGISQIYAVANTFVAENTDLISGLTADGIIDITKFNELSSSSVKDFNGGFLMSGIMMADKKLSLTRSAAKVTLKDDSGNDNFKVEEVSVYYSAKQCYLMAGVSDYWRINHSSEYDTSVWKDGLYYNTINSSNQTIEGTIKEIKASSVTEDGNVLYQCYVSPTKTHEGLKVYTYVIIKANYYGVDYYYAVPFYNSDLKDEEISEENKDEAYHNILPNHWYDLVVTRVEKPGSNSPELAIQNHNDNQIWVDIHDHAPDIYSMISDGIHELGVEREITLIQENGSSEYTGTFIVKCYAADTDIVNYGQVTIEITEGQEWIIIDENPEEVTNGLTFDKDTDNPGIQWKYRVNYNTEAKIYSTETGTIKVSWKGLTREIRVIYDPGFKISTVSDVTLSIYNAKEKTSQNIYQYWTFLSGNGVSKDQYNTSEVNNSDYNNIPQLYGISPENLSGGKTRNNGFHFPMPYGNNSLTDPWKYEYSIDFKKLGEELSKEIEIEKVAITGDQTIIDNLVWTPSTVNKYSGSLKWKEYSSDSEKAYKYATGTITFTFKLKDSSDDSNVQTLPVSLNVFHTGFFHYEGDGKYCPENDFGYYYYEVIPMGNGYWLDRNIGAKGSRLYIDTEDETNVIGLKDCAGRYYTIAEYLEFGDEEKYKKEREFDLGMCPPGYRIPNQTEWDHVRINEKFINQSSTSSNGTSYYISSFYSTGNAKMGNVYFPRARFYNQQNVYREQEAFSLEPNAGDAGAGYYWSTTLAPAEEKQYMNNWFRAFYMNGASSSYNNSSVMDHRMPVRCIDANTVTTVEEYFVSFNAHNVTHVFLFDAKNSTPLYTFPGKALGTASSSERWQYFYCTTTIPIENLLVIFTKVDENGKVTLFTKNEEKFSTDVRYSPDILDKKHAWEVKRGCYYDFCDEANDRTSPVVSDEKPDECDAVTGGSSGGSGGNDSNKGRNETDRGDSLEPIGIKLWQNSNGVSLGWNENKVEYNSWKLVPPNSKLRIYGIQEGGMSMVAIRRQGWAGNQGAFCNSDPGEFQYNGVNGYVEIELTTDLLNDIIQYGLMVTGEKFKLMYVTLILEGGELLTPELKSGDYVMTDSKKVDWNNVDVGLTTDSYDWSTVPVGSTLTLNYRWENQNQIVLKYANGEEISVYATWNNNLTNPIVVNLDGNLLNNIRNKGGIVFGGGVYYIERLELKMAK